MSKTTLKAFNPRDPAHCLKVLQEATTYTVLTSPHGSVTSNWQLLKNAMATGTLKIQIKVGGPKTAAATYLNGEINAHKLRLIQGQQHPFGAEVHRQVESLYQLVLDDERLKEKGKGAQLAAAEKKERAQQMRQAAVNRVTPGSAARKARRPRGVGAFVGAFSRAPRRRRDTPPVEASAESPRRAPRRRPRRRLRG